MLLLRWRHDHGVGDCERERVHLRIAVLKRAIVWISAAVLVIAGLSIAFWPKKKREPLQLTLQFTGDVRGRLVPCGCFTGQMGGLTPVATLLGTERVPGLLVMDVG